MAKLSKSLTTFKTVFGTLQDAIIGVVHLQPLPGSPKYTKIVNPMDHITKVACMEAEIYFKHGVDAVIVENCHDVPFQKSPHIGAETTAYMTRACAEIRRIFPDKPLGVQVLAGGNLESLAVAHATNLNFIRVEGFVFSSIADEGFIDASAAALMRKRKTLDASDDILVFADVKKKHSSHAITADLSVEDVAEAAEFFMADGVIVTGAATGKPADPQDVSATRKAVQIPVLVGSGVTASNLHAFIDKANGLIVGSDFKRDGKWYNELDERRVGVFMEEVKKLRKTIGDED